MSGVAGAKRMSAASDPAAPRTSGCAPSRALRCDVALFARAEELLHLVLEPQLVALDALGLGLVLLRVEALVVQGFELVLQLLVLRVQSLEPLVGAQELFLQGLTIGHDETLPGPARRGPASGVEVGGRTLASGWAEDTPGFARAATRGELEGLHAALGGAVPAPGLWLAPVEERGRAVGVVGRPAAVPAPALALVEGHRRPVRLAHLEEGRRAARDMELLEPGSEQPPGEPAPPGGRPYREAQQLGFTGDEPEEGVADRVRGLVRRRHPRVGEEAEAPRRAELRGDLPLAPRQREARPLERGEPRRVVDADPAQAADVGRLAHPRGAPRGGGRTRFGAEATVTGGGAR